MSCLKGKDHFLEIVSSGFKVLMTFSPNIIQVKAQLIAIK